METGERYFVTARPTSRAVLPGCQDDHFDPKVEIMPLPMAAESLTVESLEGLWEGPRSASATMIRSAVTPSVARM